MDGGGPAAAATATFTGTPAGLPAAAAGPTVRAVHATSGEILADARLSGSRSYRLTVPAGVYMLVGDASLAGRLLIRGEW